MIVNVSFTVFNGFVYIPVVNSYGRFHPPIYFKGEGRAHVNSSDGGAPCAGFDCFWF